MRDVTFAEDHACIRTANDPAVMACLRNFAIALARLLGFTNIAAALRAFAHQPRRVRAALGLSPPPIDAGAAAMAPTGSLACTAGNPPHINAILARIQPLDLLAHIAGKTYPGEPYLFAPQRADFDGAVGRATSSLPLRDRTG